MEEHTQPKEAANRIASTGILSPMNYEVVIQDVEPSDNDLHSEEILDKMDVEFEEMNANPSCDVGGEFYGDFWQEI